MRRMRLLVFSFLTLLMIVMPATAQGGSITNIVANNANLSWLQRFLDAAPDIRSKLNSGNYTLFAPSDTAFAKLASSLKVERIDLLRDPALVSAILEYHIVQGSLSSQQIRDKSGQVIPTLLDRAFISFRVNDANEITLNNVVKIDSSIRASNGMVYIIDNVLLNRVIVDLTQNLDLGSFITPNATATSESTATAEPTMTEAPLAFANLRFANFVADASPLDVYLNDNLVFESIEYGTISDFQIIGEGDYTVSIKSSTSENAETLLDSVSLNVFGGDFTSIFLSGSVANDSLNVTFKEEDFSELSSDNRMLFFYAVADAPKIDVKLGGDILLEGLSESHSAILNLDAGNYDLTVSATGDSENVLFEATDIEIKSDNYTLLALAGDPDKPDLFATSVDTNTVEQLRQAATEQATETPAPSALETVLDTLKNDKEHRFDSFIEALDAANPIVIDRLASANLTDITVLAPTNEAFDNLYALVPKSRVLGNRNLLTQVLQYHIVEGELFASDFRAAAGTSIITLLQPVQAFRVTLSGEEIRLNQNAQFKGVQFLEADIRASNGIIHVVDNVLLPQLALNAWGLS